MTATSSQGPDRMSAVSLIATVLLETRQPAGGFGGPTVTGGQDPWRPTSDVMGLLCRSRQKMPEPTRPGAARPGGGRLLESPASPFRVINP